MFDNQNNNNNTQFENQQLGNGFYGDSGVEPITGKKKGKKAAVIGGITAVALAGGCATAYGVSDTVKNQVKLRTMKPENYYAWVYETNSSTIAKDISDNYSKQLERYKEGVGINYNLSYEMPDSVKSKLKEEIGDDEDIRSIIDNIDTIAIDMNGNVKDGSIGYSLGALFNGDKLATIEYDLDQDMNVFVRCPELTEKWISMDTSSIIDEYSYDEESSKVFDLYKDILKDPESILSPSELETEINKYVSVWTDNTKDVKLEKKETVNVGGIDVEYTVAEVEITPELAKEMSTKFAEELKNDDIIKNIVVNKMGVAEADYDSDLDDLIKEITEDEADTTVDFKTYIDPTGTIRGISLTNEEGKEVKAILGKDGDQVRGEFTTDEDFRATLTATETASKTYTGTIDIESASETYNVEFGDLKVVDEVNGYTEGTVKVSGPNDISFQLDLSTDGKSQNIGYDINVDGENYGRIVLSYSTAKGDDVTIPEKSNALVVNEDTMSDFELEDYISQDELESFLKNIFTTVGMKDADEASKTLAESAFSNTGSSSYDYDFDDEGYNFDDEDYEYDWDDEDFDWDSEDFNWDDYDFEFDEDALNIEIPEISTAASA